jgi:hypothetical protein
MSQLDKSDRLVATEIYEKVKANIQPDSFGYVPSEARTCLSLDELDSFVELYLRLREIRASAVSRSLYRIADLYEANPTCLRTPFAPQTHRPNKKHIPSNMRSMARKQEIRAKHRRWTCPGFMYTPARDPNARQDTADGHMTCKYDFSLSVTQEYYGTCCTPHQH